MAAFALTGRREPPSIMMGTETRQVDERVERETPQGGSMSHGDFSGEPKTDWLTEDGREDRRMTVLEDFWFCDPKRRRWDAPKGSIVDGASIPRALWTIVGSPYTGDYRRASIVHDVACEQAVGSPAARRAADKMFFHACRAGGCSVTQATLLYLGVRVGAAGARVPAWHAAMATNSSGPRARRTPQELRMEDDFGAIADQVLAAGETDDPDILERRTDAALIPIAGIRAHLPKKRLGRAPQIRR